MLENNAGMLAAVPLRNPQARETPVGNGLRLTAPRAATAVGRFLGTKPGEKTFQLDDLGAGVWKLCDGRSTVEQIVEAFAKERRINLREAHLSVATFLNMLAKRRLIGFAVAAEGKER